jgi:hypothetical protein
MIFEQKQALDWYMKGVRDANRKKMLHVNPMEFLEEYGTEFISLGAHPAYPILQYFKYDHLPPHLQQISYPFGDIAYKLALELPQNDETNELLRKLLEAKDCAVRSAITILHEKKLPISTDSTNTP